MQLHELQQLQPLLFGNDDQLRKLAEGLLAGLQDAVDDRNGLGSELCVVVV